MKSPSRGRRTGSEQTERKQENGKRDTTEERPGRKMYTDDRTTPAPHLEPPRDRPTSLGTTVSRGDRQAQHVFRRSSAQVCLETNVVKRLLVTSYRRRTESAGNQLRHKHGGHAKLTKDRSVSEQSERKSSARCRFFKAVRLVMSVLRCMKVMIMISDELTPRTAIEMQWHTLNNSRESRKLAFNPAIYAKCRIYAKLPEWARQILDVEPGTRTDAQCWRLQALLRGLKSFDKFTEQIQLAMCRACTYYRVDGRRVILRRGHVGQYFYFIYSGSVFVNVEDFNKEGEKFVKTEVILSKGDSFGELALLKNIRRTATVSCRETSELIGVDKEVFTQLCPKIFDKELKEKVSFLSQMPLFHSKYWSQATLEEICFDAQIQEHRTNKVVVPNNKTDQWIYICMEGQCRIIKCLILEESTTQGDIEENEGLLEENELLTAEFLDSMKSKRNKSQSGTSSKPGELLREPSNLHRRKQLLQSMSLDYLDNNDTKTDSLTKMAEVNRVEEHRQRALTGVMTLTTLMRRTLTDYPDAVFLHIGTLHPGEVFDLAEILKSSKSESKSFLTLVSSGSRIIRIKQDHFRSALNPSALDHAKHVAMKNIYPSNKVLLSSYKKKMRWDRYKHQVLSEVLSTLHYRSRQSDVKTLVSAHKQRRSRDSRLVSAIRRQNEPDHVLTTEATSGLALEESVLGDHADFESRLMREVDEKLTKSLKLNAINPRSHIGNRNKRK